MIDIDDSRNRRMLSWHVEPSAGRFFVSSLLGATLALMLLSAHPVVALAAPDDAKVGNISSSIQKQKREFVASESRRKALQHRLNAVASDYLRVEHANEATEDKARATRKKLATTRANLKINKAALARRLDTMYRNGDVTLTSVLLGAQSFPDLLTRMDYLNRIGVEDAKLVSRVAAADRKLTNLKGSLENESAIQRRQIRQMQSMTTEINSALKAQIQASGSLKGRISDLERQEQLAIMARDRAKAERLRKERARLEAVKKARDRAAAEAGFRGGGSYNGSGAAEGIIIKAGGHTFPVAGPHTYSDTWGAPRSGGRRHKGADIFNPYGTPLVAVTNGSVRRSTSGLGGLSVWVTGSDGNCYYYAHLSRYGNGKTGRVKVGDIVGYNGNSGNARHTPPHVHFEIHPGCGGAVNPTPTLRSWD